MSTHSGNNPGRLTTGMLRTIGNALALGGKGGRRMCILSYHRILESPDPILTSEPDVRTFRWQMELLAECFNVLPLHDAVDALTTGDLPPRAVCITFDDGYRSTHDLALPVLRELRLPATVFVTTGCMREGNMWNDRIIEAVRRLPGNRLDMHEADVGVLSLADDMARHEAAHALIEASKYLSPKERVALTRKIEALGGHTDVHDLMLTREMVAAMAGQGIEIGGHTVSHPILTRLDDDAARAEIESGKKELEAIIHRPVRLFAYPNGKVGKDYDDRHVRMAREAGFSAAFTTAVGAASRRHDLYQLPRSRPWDGTPARFGMRLLSWLAA